MVSRETIVGRAQGVPGGAHEPVVVEVRRRVDVDAEAIQPVRGACSAGGLAFTSPFERTAPSLRNAANAAMQDKGTSFRCVSPP